MSQTPTTTSTGQQINAPFRAKSAGVSLAAILLIGLYYFANVAALLDTGADMPAGAGGLIITAVVLIIVVEAALQAVLFIGAGKIEQHSERDSVIGARASANAYMVLTVGVVAVFGSLFLFGDATPFMLANVLLLFFLLAEIVKFGSQIFYYGRSG